MSRSPLFDTFARAPVAFERGEGCWLETTDGRRMLDFTSGIAVNALGHAHPKLVAALTEQAGKLWHTSNLFQIPGQERLAATLVANSFADKVFFANSGAEAMECAIKTARRYQFVSGKPERNRIVTFAGSFHGRTLTTLAATGNPKYLEGFGPVAGGFDQVPLGDLKAVEAVIGPETAAILIEPIQGEGGVRLVSGQFLRDLRALCDKHGLLLVYDEVQTGVGRTGKLFAYEWSGVAPDIMALAKGIGGGFPVGACLATAEAAKGMTPGTHGTHLRRQPARHGGRPGRPRRHSRARLPRPRPRRWASTSSSALPASSTPIPTIVAEVRGEGLLLGVRCVKPVGDVVAALRDENLLAVAAGENVVRLLPPLIVTETEIDAGIAMLDRALTRLETVKAGAA